MFAGRFVCILLAFASAAAGGGLAYGQQVRFERFTSAVRAACADTPQRSCPGSDGGPYV